MRVLRSQCNGRHSSSIVFVRCQIECPIGGDPVRTQSEQVGRVAVRNRRASDMTEEERPYAIFYDQGHTAGLAGVPVEECPYRPAGQNRRELLARRVAWLEGHSDGIAKRRQAIADPIRATAEQRQLKTRAIAQRRYQRKVLRRAGHPERYVDRRLRQLAEQDS